MIERVIGKGKYGSARIAALLQRYDIPYVALNPGSTFHSLRIATTASARTRLASCVKTRASEYRLSAPPP